MFNCSPWQCDIQEVVLETGQKRAESKADPKRQTLLFRVFSGTPLGGFHCVSVCACTCAHDCIHCSVEVSHME